MTNEMAGKRSGGRANSALRRGAAAVGSSLVLLLAASPAMASPSGGIAPAAPRGCGKPQINVWYDSDQFGTYLKVDFSRKSSCHAGVAALKATVYCQSHAGRVYDEHVGGEPRTVTRSLPSKSKCSSFYATAKIVYYAQPSENYTDSWRWDWGNYPA